MANSVLTPQQKNQPINPDNGLFTDFWYLYLQSVSSAIAVLQSAVPAPTPSGGGNALVLQVTNTLAIESNASLPLILDTTRQSTALRAVVTDAPTGSDIIFTVRVSGSLVITGTLLDGDTVMQMPVGVAFGPGVPISMDITQVGSTFPGANLTVVIYVS